MKYLLAFTLCLISLTCKTPIKQIAPPIYRVIKTDGGTYDNIEVNLIISKDTQVVRNFIDSTINDGDPNYSLNNVDAITLYSEGYPVVIWIQNIPTKPIEYGTLNHELFHALKYTMEYVGIPLSDETNETWAYQFGYLTKKIYDQIDKIKKE